MELGHSPRSRVYYAQKQNDTKASTKATRLHQKILPPHRCLRYWRGRNTLTGGRIHLPQFQTQTTSHRLLLGNLHPDGTKLRHIQTRTTGDHEIPSTLETLSNMDEGTFRHTNGPRKLTVLENPKETQQEDSEMACRATRLLVQNRTRPRKNPHCR